jgi:signal transduction histidine kinase
MAAMWSYIQIAAYASLVLGYLLLLSVRYRLGRGRVQRLLESSLVLATVWTLVLGTMDLLAPGAWWAFVWRRVAQIGLVVLALLTAEFAAAFVQRPSLRRVRLGIVLPLALIALVLDALPARLAARLPLLGPELGELAGLLWMLAWLFSCGTAWAIGILAYRKATGSKHRNRVRYILMVVFAFTLGDALLLIGGGPQVHVGLAARLLGLTVAAFAVLRYDLPDIRRQTLFSLRWALLLGATLVLYLLVVLGAGLVSGTLPDLVDWASGSWLIVLAWAAAVVVDVTLRPRLRALLDRALLGRAYDVRRALRTHSQQISLMLDPDRLAATTLEWLKTTFGVERSAVILWSFQGEEAVELRILRATAGSQAAPKLFEANSRFIAHFRNFGRPLSQYDVDMLTWFQGMPGGERKWLQGLALDLYIPVVVGGEPVALLALGPKGGEQPYSEEDLETLMTLAGQTGAALENARLVADLRSMQKDLHDLSSELAETNRQLTRLDQTKADFVAIASHELRTPLAQIYGYSDFLSRMTGDAMGDAQAVHRFIQGILRGAGRLKRVVDAMVDVTLIETGALKLSLVSVPITTVVEISVNTIRPAAEQRRQTIILHDLSDLPPVQVDMPRIGQVLSSLLSNAVKFTPDGGRIMLSGQRGLAPSGEQYVELLVSDTGIGIDADQQSLIFEKFYRAEDTLSHSTNEVTFKGAGPGLGLAIVWGIIKAHGGQIWVESAGRDEATCPGSTFHVRLPAASPVKG